MAAVQIHFDGDIAKNHQVSMRTLGKTLTHLQNTFDRACIENRKGALWKNARMPQAYYADVELLVEAPREGGYVLDFLAKNSATKKIIDRISGVLTTAVEEAKYGGEETSRTIEDSINIRKMQISKGIIKPEEFISIYDQPDTRVVRRYGDRAIAREINQILAIIRAGSAGQSTFELTLSGETTATFEFNKYDAKKFHDTVTKRSIGEPVIYVAQVISLDKNSMHGKIKNVATDATANLIFQTEKELMLAIHFFENSTPMQFIGCPFIEYGAFDPMAGDIYFIELV